MKGGNLCQVNYAVSVKGIMPHSARCDRQEALRYADITHVVLQKIDIRGLTGCCKSHNIFDIHPYAEVCHGPIYPLRGEACCSSRAWRFESSAGESERQRVSLPRFLRPLRLGPSQIRDVASSSYRGTIDYQHSSGLWLLSPILLSGSGGLDPVGASWTLASATGTATSPQAQRRGAGVHRTHKGRRPFTANSGSGPTSQGEIWFLAAPPKHRARPCAATKKTGEASTVSPSPEGPVLDVSSTGRYEALRMQALGVGCAKTTAVEMAMLLRYGLPSWLSASSHERRSTQSETKLRGTEKSLLLDGLRGEVAIVLASMALASTWEGGE